MHYYSIDTNEREKVLFIIFIVSIALHKYFYGLLGNLENISHLTQTLFIELPSAAGIFWGIYRIFDNYAWKFRVFRFNYYFIEPIIQTPILEGYWEGDYFSKRKCSDTNKTIDTEGKVSFNIKQTWTKINIIQQTETSTSCSEVANLSINDRMGIVLKYQYLNESKAKGPDTMFCHTGFNKLRYLPEKEVLEGEYFTDKDRQTYGSLEYRRT